eukprot:2154010-Rhodomonas_salina.8
MVLTGACRLRHGGNVGRGGGDRGGRRQEHACLCARAPGITADARARCSMLCLVLTEVVGL